MLNFIEINKNEWLAISTTQVMNSSVYGCQIASCVIVLGLEVEASGKAIVWENSPLGSRVRVG